MSSLFMKSPLEQQRSGRDVMHKHARCIKHLKEALMQQHGTVEDIRSTNDPGFNQRIRTSAFSGVDL